MAKREIKEYKVKRREQLLPRLAEVLNEYHQSQFPLAFWDQLVGSHIHFALSTEKIRQTKKFKPKKIEIFEPQNTGRVLSSKESFIINIKLYIKFLLRNQIFGRNQNLKKFESGEFAFNPFIDKTFDKKEVVQVRGEKLGFLPFFRSVSTRRKLVQLGEKYAHEDVFLYNLIIELPLLTIEYLSYFLGKNNVSSFTSAARLHLAVPAHAGISVLVAFLKSKGAKVFHYQHGGFYGELAFHPGYEKERKYGDGFITWGWQMNPEDIPGKALKIKKFLEDYKQCQEKKTDITLILPKVKIWNSKHISEKLKMLNELAEKEEFKVEVRQKLSKFEKSYISLKKFPRLLPSNQKLSIGKQCAKSRLVMHIQHPTTNFLECVAVDQPVVALLTNDQPSSIVESFYQFYLDRNIFFQDFPKLLDFVGANNFERHCQEVFLMKEHNEFKNSFVNTEYGQ
jgi:hypothetical protein